MEKLEAILHAEEASRRAIADARTQAREIMRELRNEVELIGMVSERETGEEGAALRAAALRDAEAQAAVIERDAESALGDVVRQAESHYDDAVEAVIAALME